jgi:hypothetical protein
MKPPFMMLSFALIGSCWESSKTSGRHVHARVPATFVTQMAVHASISRSLCRLPVLDFVSLTPQSRCGGSACAPACGGTRGAIAIIKADRHRRMRSQHCLLGWHFIISAVSLALRDRSRLLCFVTALLQISQQ